MTPERTGRLPMTKKGPKSCDSRAFSTRMKSSTGRLVDFPLPTPACTSALKWLSSCVCVCLSVSACAQARRTLLGHLHGQSRFPWPRLGPAKGNSRLGKARRARLPHGVPAHSRRDGCRGTGHSGSPSPARGGYGPVQPSPGVAAAAAAARGSRGADKQRQPPVPVPVLEPVSVPVPPGCAPPAGAAAPTRVPPAPRRGGGTHAGRAG